LDVTSEEIRSSRFQGTRHVYDRREIDAFLHRVAATLEVYERRVAVTQAHVESLEKALDLAHSRARSVRDRELRIAELETALAAAQHNYESLQAELESNPPGAAAEAASGEIAAEARRRADQLVEEAAREALAIRNDAEDIRTEAAETAAGLIADAEAAANESRQMAHLEQAKMLEELANERSEAKAALDQEIEAKRAALLAELEEEQASLSDQRVPAADPSRDELDKVEARVAEALDQASDAEAARDQLIAELEQMREEAAAERQRLMDDAEQMVAEAVAQAEIDRDRLLAHAQAELAAVREAQSVAIRQDPEDDEAMASAEAENAGLRRQLAQMRTALSNIQARFANAGELSSEELRLAAALVDLDLHDVDQFVDLTALEGPTDGEADEADESATVQVKSKWAGPGEIPAGSLQDGRASEEVSPPAWRRHKEGVGSNVSSEPTPEPSPPQEETLGFYERRLAGLRERLKDALPPDV
jgi:chemotaxis protein histidine kinase CheA